MKIKHIFLMLTIFNGLNFICKAADACEKPVPVLTISDIKKRAEELFGLRKKCKSILLLVPKDQMVNKNIVDEITYCENELRKLLNSAQIISMPLYSNIKNRLDSLLAEERFLLE